MYYLIKSDGLSIYKDTNVSYHYELVLTLAIFVEGTEWVKTWRLNDEDQLNAWCIFRSEDLNEVIEHACFEVL